MKNLLSNEIALMCDAVSYCAHHALAKESQPAENVDVQKLERLSDWHGVFDGVMQYLTKHQDQYSYAVTVLKNRSYRNAIKQALYVRQLTDLADLFHVQDIDYVVFKGAAAKAQFYQSSVSMVRSSSDIDLLVSPSHFSKAVAVLIELGYSSVDCDNPEDVARYAANSADKLCKRGLVFRHVNERLVDIDLHWRITNTFSLPLTTEIVLVNKALVKVDGRKVFAPCFEHHFIASAIHGYLDYFFQLKHLMDLYFAAHQENYDEKLILDMAEQFGVRDQVHDSIRLTKLMFAESTCGAAEISQYEKACLERYISFDGWVPRNHKAEGDWDIADKLRYIISQIRTRSRKVAWYEPITNRFLVKFEQVPKSHT